MVSADNAHAIHPAHPEYADQGEFPVLGGGVVIKYNANQRYTTDTVSAAVFQGICQRADVPVQRYSNRADLPGGSAKEKPSVAEVISVGPGGMVDGKEVTMTVKPGDKVITSQYAGTKVTLEDVEYVVVRQGDILAIVE